MTTDRDGVRRLETIGALVVVAAGTAWHFVYGWSGDNRVLGAVAPVNESVWEHLKLVVFPVAGLALCERRVIADAARLWWAKLVEVVIATLFITAFFYTYTGALGTDSIVAVDIASFVAAVAVGQWLSYRLLVSPASPPLPRRLSLAAFVAVAALFVVLTYAPPHVPLFRDSTTGAYGRG